MIATHLVLLNVWAVLTAGIPLNSDTCYYPAGAVAADSIPCYNATGDGSSHCCNPITDVCLDNGLCYAQGGYGDIARKSCTDKSWVAASCPSYCRSSMRFTFCLPKWFH